MLSTLALYTQKSKQLTPPVFDLATPVYFNEVQSGVRLRLH